MKPSLVQKEFEKLFHSSQANRTANHSSRAIFENTFKNDDDSPAMRNALEEEDLNYNKRLINEEDSIFDPLQSFDDLDQMDQEDEDLLEEEQMEEEEGPTEEENGQELELQTDSIIPENEKFDTKEIYHEPKVKEKLTKNNCSKCKTSKSNFWVK
jgi:hypothetical protein